MVLLKDGTFEFNNIISNSYKIEENVYDVLAKQTMADGSERRNYGLMGKTNIKVKFGMLDETTMQLYLSHFADNEKDYTYFSPRTQTLVTKKFYVEKPTNTIYYADDDLQQYGEFEVELQQIGEADD